MSPHSPSLIHADGALEAVSQGVAPRSDDPVCPSCASQNFKPPSDSPKLSRNPYRQNLMTSAPALQRSPSEETQNSVPARVKPARAVFHDLLTAHSSITSGTARGRSRRLSNNLPEAYEEQDSIPLKEFERPKRRITGTQPLLDRLPLPPPPAAIVQHRYDSHSQHLGSCLLTGDDRFACCQPGKQGKLALPSESLGQPNSLFANVKSVFTSASSPAPVSAFSNWPGRRREKGRQCALCVENSSSIYHSGMEAAPSGSLPLNDTDNRSPLDSPRKHAFDSYDEAVLFPGLQSTPALNERIFPVPGQHSKTTRVLSNAVVSSLPDSSTVGNIYKHYAPSDPLQDFDSDSGDAKSEFDSPNGYRITRQPFKTYGLSQAYSRPSSRNEPHETALHVRKQQRADRTTTSPPGQPPDFRSQASRILPHVFSETLHKILQTLLRTAIHTIS